MDTRHRWSLVFQLSPAPPTFCFLWFRLCKVNLFSFTRRTDGRAEEGWESEQEVLLVIKGWNWVDHDLPSRVEIPGLHPSRNSPSGQGQGHPVALPLPDKVKGNSDLMS